LVFEISLGGNGPAGGSYTGALKLNLIKTIENRGDEACIFDAKNDNLYTLDTKAEKLWVINLNKYPITPVSGISGLIIGVQQMVSATYIKKPIGNELINFLNSAINYLAANKTKDAINRLNSFVVKMNDLLKSRQISTEDGQTRGKELIAEANRIINQLKGITKSLEADSLFYNYETLSDEDLITASKLTSIYPNPFGTKTTINYEIADNQESINKVLLRVYDMNGRLIRTLVDQSMQAGRYTITWDGMFEQGGRAPQGTYFILFRNGDVKEVKAIMLIR
jgi:hypothetical protein